VKKGFSGKPGRGVHATTVETQESILEKRPTRNGEMRMPDTIAEPLFESREEEAIATFIYENELQWNRDNWDDYRRQVACCKFGIEYQKTKLAVDVSHRILDQRIRR